MSTDTSRLYTQDRAKLVTMSDAEHHDQDSFVKQDEVDTKPEPEQEGQGDADPNEEVRQERIAGG